MQKLPILAPVIGLLSATPLAAAESEISAAVAQTIATSWFSDLESVMIFGALGVFSAAILAAIWLLRRKPRPRPDYDRVTHATEPRDWAARA